MALRKLLAAHILGSPSGGAGAVRRLRGQVASLTGRSRGYRPYGRVRPGRWFLFRLPPIKVKGKVEAFLKKSFTKKLYVSPRWLAQEPLHDLLLGFLLRQAQGAQL